MTKEAFVLVDTQPGFMPADEEHTPQYGYGELPVPHGDEIIEPVNDLLKAFAKEDAVIITTQDWHPKETAHFSESPNFETDWPEHCVAGTLGAEIDPRVNLPGTTHRYIKGFDPLERGEDDTSYSARYAIDPVTDMSFFDFLESRGVERVTFAGLALEHCVGDSAIDTREQTGLEVDVVLDATRGINDERIAAKLQKFAEIGINVTTTEAVLARLALQGAEEA